MDKIIYYTPEEFSKIVEQKKVVGGSGPGLFNLLAISLTVQIFLENISYNYWWYVILLLFTNYIISLFIIIPLALYFKIDKFRNSLVIDIFSELTEKLFKNNFLALFIIMFFNFKIMNITILSTYSWWFVVILICIDILPCFMIFNKNLKNNFNDKLR